MASGDIPAAGRLQAILEALDGDAARGDQEGALVVADPGKPGSPSLLRRGRRP